MYERLTLEDIVEAHMVLDAYDDAQARLDAQAEKDKPTTPTPRRPRRR